jgi:murein L,D-transpeptidase YcbB/YkuD
MKPLLTFLLTKTKLLRYGAGLLISCLIGWGAVKTEDKEKATEAATVLAVVIASALIEKRKEDDAKQVQRENGLKADGWIGPVSREKLHPHTIAARPTAGARGGLFKG